MPPFGNIYGEAAELRARLDAEARARQSAVVRQVTEMAAAQRAIVVEAWGRMVRREVEKARRHQATPAKLRAWVETFYALHEDICCQTHEPAVRAHFVWTNKTTDPAAVTRALVRDELDRAKKQLLAVADEDGQDLTGALEALLLRWEATRPDGLADRLLREEMDHVVA